MRNLNVSTGSWLLSAISDGHDAMQIAPCQRQAPGGAA
jgi:hypothetical protein